MPLFDVKMPRTSVGMVPRLRGPGRWRPSWPLLRLLGTFAVVLMLLGVGVRPALAGNEETSREVVLPEPPSSYSSYSTGWMELSYSPELAGKVEVLKHIADQTRNEFRTLLGDQALTKVHVRVAPSAKEMTSLTPPGIAYPKYASGVAYPAFDLVLLTAAPRFPGESLDLAQVFRHELLHIALHDAVAERAPRWFDEGLAVHLSGELYMDRLTTLATATLTKRLLPLRTLTHRFPSGEADASVAYAQAADLVRYLLRGDDEKRFPMLLERMRAGQSFEEALEGAYSLSLADLETEWQKDVASRYTFWPVLFGGSTIWGVAFVLLFAGYYRKRRQTRDKLARWAKEEAIEDARIELLRRALSAEGQIRVLRIPVSSAEDGAPRSDTAQEASFSDENASSSAQTNTDVQAQSSLTLGGVPRVEHEGRWHTLH